MLHCGFLIHYNHKTKKQFCVFAEERGGDPDLVPILRSEGAATKGLQRGAPRPKGSTCGGSAGTGPTVQRLQRDASQQRDATQHVTLGASKRGGSGNHKTAAPS